MLADLDRIEKKVSDLEARRDRVMQVSKDLIRIAGKSIALMHAEGPESAAGLLKDLKAAKKELSGVEQGFEYYSLQAHQEYTEAAVLHGILLEKRVPRMSAVEESEVPYLLGLMDVIGELKRESIESIRKGRYSDAESYYGIMSNIYDSTLHMRFAGSILPDFRRKQDSARIQLEGVMNELAHLSHEGKIHSKL